LVKWKLNARMEANIMENFLKGKLMGMGGINTQIKRLDIQESEGKIWHMVQVKLSMGQPLFI